MRLPARTGERIDRTVELQFSFGGRTIRAFRGDTIGSALYAAGQRIFSRSFKYHRPRGLLCCSGGCAGCLMDVDGVPNVRVCVRPVEGGEVVRPQIDRGTLQRDPLSVVDRVGGPFTPVGFYYRTMIRPRRAWPRLERALRGLTGLGRVDPGVRERARFDGEHRHVDVLVVGGGRSGRAAAASHAAAGRRVVLVDENPLLEALELGDVEVLGGARALAVYEGNLVPVAAGPLLLRFRADTIVIATGALEQPLVFPGNDLVGVVLASAARRLVRDWSIRPGRRAVLVAADEDALAVAGDLDSAGVEIATVVDARERGRSLEAKGRNGILRAVAVDGETIDCDLAIVSGGRQPAVSLLAQAGARIEYDAGRGVFVPRGLPPRVEAAGSASGEGTSAPEPLRGNGGRAFVCLCEDVTHKDLRRAVAEGFDSVELAKRYTTVTMGPCQGRLCHLNAVRLLAGATGTPAEELGGTTARPPWAPAPLGLLAGRHAPPGKRTPMHGRHLELGAEMVWTGSWSRPQDYGDAAAETRAVHQTVAAIDVSTLGKLLVSGGDAVRFLETVFPNRFGSLAAGRVRYAVLGTEAGRVIDDGTVVRLGEERFLVTTTSTGSDVVFEAFERWREEWRLDVRIANLSGSLAGIAVSGPRARELLQRLTPLDLSPEAFPYLDAREGLVAGVPSLLMRIGFVGELGYELHFPSAYGEFVWDTVLEQGADLGVRPFGVESLKVLRLEKQHVLVGQDTDSESNLLELGLGRMVAWEKERFVGKSALVHVRDEGPRRALVGFVAEGGVVPREGACVVERGVPVGRVTSARWSAETGAAIGLALLPPRLAAAGTAIEIDADGALASARVQTEAFFDPEGARLRS